MDNGHQAQPEFSDLPPDDLYSNIGNADGEQLAFYHCVLQAARHRISLWRFVEEVLMSAADEVRLAASDVSYARGYLTAVWTTLEDIGAVTMTVMRVPTVHPAFERTILDNVGWAGHDRLCNEPLLDVSFVAGAAKTWAERRDASADAGAES